MAEVFLTPSVPEGDGGSNPVTLGSLMSRRTQEGPVRPDSCSWVTDTTKERSATARY